MNYNQIRLQLISEKLRIDISQFGTTRFVGIQQFESLITLIITILRTTIRQITA